MVDMVLFPSSFFDTSKVDEAMQKEYDAVLASGLFKVALFGNDKWFNEGKLIIKGAPEGMHEAVYRGWMMKPDQYKSFYWFLYEKNISLVTSPEEYARMHLFPNIYESIRDDTAKTEVYPLHSPIDVEKVKGSFDRFMVKDYVKSVKGTEFPRFFDSSVTQEDFDRWMEVFYHYRGDLLTGGICIKEYLDLKRYGDKTNEYRVFYANHKIVTICRNSGQGKTTPEPPKQLIEKYRNLESPYYTVDYAELSDGTWRIVEAGDGGVSGLSNNQDYNQYYRKLFLCFLTMGNTYLTDNHYADGVLSSMELYAWYKRMSGDSTEADWKALLVEMEKFLACEAVPPKERQVMDFGPAEAIYMVVSGYEYARKQEKKDKE